MNKSFNKSEFDKFDELGKKIVRKYFDSDTNYLVAENPNDYMADLILLEKCEDGRYIKVALLEVGIRNSWKTKTWPSSWQLHIEKRKAKYLNQSLPVWFCVLNGDLSSMILFTKILTEYDLAATDNRHLRAESMYLIPSSDFEVIHLIPDAVDLDFI